MQRIINQDQAVFSHWGISRLRLVSLFILVIIGLLLVSVTVKKAMADAEPKSQPDQTTVLDPLSPTDQPQPSLAGPSFAPLAGPLEAPFDPDCLTPAQIAELCKEKMPEALLMELKTEYKRNNVYYIGRLFQDNPPVEDHDTKYVTKTKYEFELDAYSGKVRKWYPRHFYYHVTEEDHQERTIKSRVEIAQQLTTAVPNSEVADITWDMNKEYVFYAGTLHTANEMYEFVVDAYSGKVIDFQKIEIQSENQLPQYLDVAIVERHLLGRVPGGVVMSMDLGTNENGYPIYQGSIQKRHLVYEFVIDALTGDILQWSQHIAHNLMNVRRDHRHGPSIPIVPLPPLVPMPKIPSIPTPPIPPSLQY